MFRKNTSGQFIGFQLLLTATGAIATGLSPTVRRCIDGTFAAGDGTVTEDTGTGGYKYAMSQADTNGNDIQFWFTATGAIPVCVNIVTTAANPTDGAALGLTNLDATITSRMATYTQPTGFLAASFPTDPADESLVIAATDAIMTRIGAAGAGLTALGDVRLAYLDVGISTRLATAGYTAPDNTNISAIKAKTDGLSFTIAGQLDANIQYVNDVLVNGNGSSGTPWGP